MIDWAKVFAGMLSATLWLPFGRCICGLLVEFYEDIFHLSEIQGSGWQSIIKGSFPDLLFSPLASLLLMIFFPFYFSEVCQRRHGSQLPFINPHNCTHICRNSWSKNLPASVGLLIVEVYYDVAAVLFVGRGCVCVCLAVFERILIRLCDSRRGEYRSGRLFIASAVLGHLPLSGCHIWSGFIPIA